MIRNLFWDQDVQIKVFLHFWSANTWMLIVFWSWNNQPPFFRVLMVYVKGRLMKWKDMWSTDNRSANLPFTHKLQQCFPLLCLSAVNSPYCASLLSRAQSTNPVSSEPWRLPKSTAHLQHQHWQKLLFALAACTKASLPHIGSISPVQTFIPERSNYKELPCRDDRNIRRHVRLQKTQFFLFTCLGL